MLLIMLMLSPVIFRFGLPLPERDIGYSSYSSLYLERTFVSMSVEPDIDITN